MGDIISIDEKIRDARNKKDFLIRKQKIHAVQKVFQCTHCSFKCEKCGIQLKSEDLEPGGCKGHSINLPYRFCNACAEEYRDYIERLKGRGDKACYWRNSSWMRIWQAWIAYQGSIDAYMKTTEFKRLVKELQQPGLEP